jgi:OOP family OmpA-OmpF porin
MYFRNQLKFKLVHAIVFLSASMFLPFLDVSAQSILKKIKSKVEEKTTEKILDQTDKALSKGLDKTTNTEQKSTKEEADKKYGKNNQFQMTKSYGKYDFVPGDSIIYINEFLTDALSELPTGWNSNGGSVIMKIDGLEGQWLRLAQKTVNLTDNKKTFGHDFTVEFDSFLQFDFKGWLPPSFRFGLLATGKEDPGANKVLSNPIGEKSFYVEISPLNNGANILLESNQKFSRYFHGPVSFNAAAKNWYGKVVHVSMQVQKERLRIWVDGEKIYDAPKAIPIEGVFNQLYFQLSSSSYDNEQVSVYISNIKIAKGLPDTRNKLLDEGRFSTTGIHFDSGSSDIKPESAGVLKMISDLLNQNPNVKVRIVGHTDAVGDEKSNQLLSEQRALAVKNTLKANYGINDDRLESIGKGESEPVANNILKEGMAQNRRIEFIKL